MFYIILTALLTSALIALYCGSILFYFYMLSKELPALFQNMNFRTFLWAILVFICGFLPLFNTIIGYRAYNDWRNN